MSGIAIDTVTPTISAVTVPSSNSIDGVGDVITISLKLSEPVTVHGSSAYLTLNTGGTAVYSGQSADGGSLIFKYTVGAGDINVDALAIKGVSLAALPFRIVPATLLT